MELNFKHVNSVPSSGLIPGCIYFDKSKGVIKVATSELVTELYSGIIDATWEEDIATLTLTPSVGEPIVITIPKALTYMADGTTITQSGKGPIVFSLAEALKSLIESAVQTAKGDKYVSLTKSGTKITAAAKMSNDVGANEDKLVTGSTVKTYVDAQILAKLSSIYKYKGSCTYTELPEDAEIGDVWDVTDSHGNIPAGTNYAWNGSSWDPLAGTIDLSNYLTKTEAEQTYVKKSQTINSKPLSENIVLGGEDIIVGGTSTYKSNTVAEAIEKLSTWSEWE